MKSWLFNVKEKAVINQNAINGLPNNIGNSVEITELLESGLYDYRVRFPDGSYTNVRENELNKIDHNNQNVKIALIGKMRSGKDTIADYIIANYGFTKYAFGDELKRYYHELFGNTESKPREGYQWIGQTMRQRDPDIWVKKCFEKINGEKKSNIVISDLRQPNEYLKCKSEEYVFIKVNCDDGLRLKRIMEKNDNFNMSDLKHETEMHIDNFEYDYIINNDGSLEDLYKQFDDILIKVKGAEKY